MKQSIQIIAHNYVRCYFFQAWNLSKYRGLL